MPNDPSPTCSAVLLTGLSLVPRTGCAVLPCIDCTGGAAGDCSVVDEDDWVCLQDVATAAAAAAEQDSTGGSRHSMTARKTGWVRPLLLIITCCVTYLLHAAEASAFSMHLNNCAFQAYWYSKLEPVAPSCALEGIALMLLLVSHCSDYRKAYST